MASEIKSLLSRYDEAFTQKFGARYPISASKDAAIAKQLLSRYTLEQLSEWIDIFFALEDAWLAGTTYSFGVFRSQLGKVIAKQIEQADPLAKLPEWQRRSIAMSTHRVIK
jgi:hypothetical protein